jgi:hypothetical protein
MLAYARRRIMRAINELRQAPQIKGLAKEFEMKLPAYTNEEKKYLGVAQHEFHPHPAGTSVLALQVLVYLLYANSGTSLLALHEFHPHPADFLDTHPYIDFEYADAVEEGEQVLVYLLS